MANQFCYSKGGVSGGPVDATALKKLVSSGDLQAGDLVRRQENQKWVRVDRIPELERLLVAALPPLLSPDELAEPSVLSDSLMRKRPVLDMEDQFWFKQELGDSFSEIGGPIDGARLMELVSSGDLRGEISVKRRENENWVRVDSVLPALQHLLVLQRLGELANREELIRGLSKEPSTPRCDDVRQQLIEFDAHLKTTFATAIFPADNYVGLLAKLSVGLSRLDAEGTCPTFAEVARRVHGHYAEICRLLQTFPRQGQTIIGGGFGLVGMVEGMAIAAVASWVVNSFVRGAQRAAGAEIAEHVQRAHDLLHWLVAMAYPHDS